MAAELFNLVSLMKHIKHVKDSSLYFLSPKLVNREVWNLPVLGDPKPLMSLNTESRPGWCFWGGVRGWIKGGSWGTVKGEGLLPTSVLTKQVLM